jgi:hypothetical protein
MEWLFKPKVQLGLFVNFVFVMFTLISSSSGGHAYERAAAVPSNDFVTPPNTALPYIPLPPPSGPSKAVFFGDRNSGEYSVYLPNDMDIARRQGFVLQLSPIFIVHNRGEEPRAVLLRFTSYSGAQYFAYDRTLVLKADGQQVWPDATWKNWNEETVPRSVALGSNGRVVETVGKEIPYEVFAEVVKARRVSLSLGPEELELTPEQLGALRDMHRLAAAPQQEQQKQQSNKQPTVTVIQAR